MHHRTRTSLRDGLSLAVIAGSVAGLIALVSSGHPAPRLSGPQADRALAHGAMPPVTYAIRQAETRNAVALQAAFNRIGFDLDAVASGYTSVPRVLLAALPPDLERLDSAEARKDLFLRTLLPVVLYVNDRIGEDRAALLALDAKVKTGQALTEEDLGLALRLGDKYDQPDVDLDALLRKVDVIPPSLTLAQAIEESGWGTSRIAREQNALFGQFAADSDGAWDYRNFASLTEAVEAYARNLNTHKAYREFRQVRAQMRNREGGLDAVGLAATMHRYSERGDDYVHALRGLIRSNGLDAFDGSRLNGRSVATILASAN